MGGKYLVDANVIQNYATGFLRYLVSFNKSLNFSNKKYSRVDSDTCACQPSPYHLHWLLSITHSKCEVRQFCAVKLSKIINEENMLDLAVEIIIEKIIPKKHSDPGMNSTPVDFYGYPWKIFAWVYSTKSYIDKNPSFF